jgi:hypothetical protein
MSALNETSPTAPQHTNKNGAKHANLGIETRVFTIAIDRLRREIERSGTATRNKRIGSLLEATAPLPSNRFNEATTPFFAPPS